MCSYSWLLKPGNPNFYCVVNGYKDKMEYYSTIKEKQADTIKWMNHKCIMLNEKGQEWKFTDGICMIFWKQQTIGQLLPRAGVGERKLTSKDPENSWGQRKYSVSWLLVMVI